MRGDISRWNGRRTTGAGCGWERSVRWPDPLAGLALDVIAGKWVLPVLEQLSEGPKRYTELQGEIQDVAGSMLTRTLRRMERNGFVTRTVHPAIPPEVEYSLTPLAKTLEEPLAAMARWAERHLEDIQAARRRYGLRKRAS